MSKRSSTHNVVQKNGKIRDFFTCQVCGSKNNVEGHHIIDYQFSGAASTDNIISLCHACHNAVHKGLLNIFKF